MNYAVTKLDDGRFAVMNLTDNELVKGFGYVPAYKKEAQAEALRDYMQGHFNAIAELTCIWHTMEYLDDETFSLKRTTS